MCPKDPGGGRRRMGSGTRLTKYRELRPPLPAQRPPSPVRADRHRHLGTGHRAREATDIHRQEPRTATRRRRRTTAWPSPRWAAHSSFGSTEWVRFWPLSLASSRAARSQRRCFFWVYGVGAILAIVFGFIARSQIKQSNGTQQGGGMALAGIIIGFAGIVIGIRSE